MITLEFLLTSLVVVLIPGTGVIFTVSSAIFLGRRASIAAAFGCTIGIVPHLLACILGLSVILHMSAVAFQVIRYVGSAYLLYLAYSMWKNSGRIQIDSKNSAKTMRAVALKGFLINILNPKLSIFFLAFLPLFIPPASPSPTLQLLLLSALFMLMTFIIFVIYGLLANYFRKQVVESPRNAKYLQRSFAALFALFGVKLALTE